MFIMTDTEIIEEKKGIFSSFGQFKRMFWVLNTLELFERGAYYGMLAILGVHVVNNLLIEEYVYGILYSILTILLYFVPILSAALAEKYGYKQVLVVAFGILTFGYFFTSFVGEGQVVMLIVAFLLIGIGAGAFKPIISAGIAHITETEQRNLAYSIYYWMINLGAFCVPLALGILFPSQEAWNYIFIVSGILIIVNIVISLFFVTEVMEPKRDLVIAEALKKIVPALKDKKFMVLILIYAGFWFGYAVNHTFLPIYMVDFHRMPAWFPVPILGIINPGTIIATGPFLGKLVEKYKSLNVMMVGMVVYMVGLLMVFFSNSSELFVAGIVIYSLGEFIVHPGFISYVSKIAPKDKVAIYMGIIFISTGLGIALAGTIHGMWYYNFVTNMHMPKFFGALVASAGGLTIGLLVLYNRWVNKQSMVEEHEFEDDKSMWTKVTTAAIAFLFIPAILFVGFAAGTDVYYGGGEDVTDTTTAADWAGWTLEESSMGATNGYLLEGESFTMEQSNISAENVNTVTVTLTWTDEEDLQPYNLRTYENQPDGFSLSIKDPTGKSWNAKTVYNTHGSEGVNEVPIEFNATVVPFLNGTGDWEISVNMVEAGMFATDQGPGAIGYTDEGNDFMLEVVYSYYTKE